MDSKFIKIIVLIIAICLIVNFIIPLVKELYQYVFPPIKEGNTTGDTNTTSPPVQYGAPCKDTPDCANMVGATVLSGGEPGKCVDKTCVCAGKDYLHNIICY